MRQVVFSSGAASTACSGPCSQQKDLGGKRRGMGEVRRAGSFAGGGEEGRGGTCTDKGTG